MLEGFHDEDPCRPGLARHLRRDVQRGLRIQRLSRNDAPRQAALFKIRHHEIRTFRAIGNFLDGNDVRVLKPFEVAGLLQETVNGVLIGDQFGFDELDRYFAAGGDTS